MKDLNIKKLYYSISEVSRLVGEEHYVLRYWETEFDQLKPQKNRAGNRIYTQKDIAVIRAIKKLLRDNRYTIDGAKDIMKGSFDPNTGELLELEEADQQAESTEVEEVIVAGGEQEDTAIALKRSDLLEIRDTLRSVLEILA